MHNALVLNGAVGLRCLICRMLERLGAIAELIKREYSDMQQKSSCNSSLQLVLVTRFHNM